MKATVEILIILWMFSIASLCHAAEGWSHDYEYSLKRAKYEGKYILASFTGSDWCHWCKRLHKEIFGTEIFQRWAQDRFVLLEVDFPRREHQPTALKEQNSLLSEKYNIRGFPTILFLDPDGHKVGQSGYQRGGARNWIKVTEEKVLKDLPLLEAVRDASSIRIPLPPEGSKQTETIDEKDKKMVFLANGHILRGVVTYDEKGRVKINTGTGILTLEKKDIDHIK